MKTKYSLILMIGLLLVGCGKKEIVGTDKVITQVRPLSAFSSLSISGYYKVNITIGNPQAVTLSTNGNLFPYIQTNVKSKTLTVQTKRGYILRPQGVPAVDIVMPVISEIEMSGNNQLTIKGLTHGALKLNLSGSNQFAGLGAVDTFTIKSSGNTNINAQKLVANEMDIDSMGNIKVLSNVKNSLRVNVAGMGTISYVGNPKVRQTINGSASVTRVQETINK